MTPYNTVMSGKRTFCYILRSSAVTTMKPSTLSTRAQVLSSSAHGGRTLCMKLAMLQSDILSCVTSAIHM